MAEGSELGLPLALALAEFDDVDVVDGVNEALRQEILRTEYVSAINTSPQGVAATPVGFQNEAPAPTAPPTLIAGPKSMPANPGVPAYSDA